MRICICIALALLAAALPSAADASIAGRGGSDGDLIAYAAGPGEQNRLTVSAAGKSVTFEDPGADIEAGVDCVAAGPHRVTCTNEGLQYYLSVQLEDGDDEVSTSGERPADAFYISFDGQSGDDTLRAGSWPAALDGGVGSDDLHGGPGSPALDGIDQYVRDNRDRVPRQAPAKDTIECVAAPDGKPGSPATIDALDVVSGPCGSTTLYAHGFGLVNGTPGNDMLYGVTGPTRIYGFEGDDGLYPGPGDRSYGGPGNDRMVGSGLLLGGKGDDRIEAIAQGRASLNLGGGEGEDFITGSQRRDRIDGGSGSDRISAREGPDAIDARDGEHDVVRCGPGRDIVSADKRDTVGSDCETVLHRSLPRQGPPASRRSPGRNRHCAESKAKGSRIWARTSTTVVYGRGFYTYACLFKLGRPRRLIDEGGGIKVGPAGKLGVKIQGRYVAYATYGSAIGDEFDRIYVFDVRAGVPLLVEGSTFITSIALKPNGSVAWIQGSDVQDRDEDTTSYEVRKLSLAEKQGNVLLDRGTGIAPKSLKLAPDGGSVTWTRDGAVQTAPLG